MDEYLYHFEDEKCDQKQSLSGAIADCHNRELCLHVHLKSAFQRRVLENRRDGPLYWTLSVYDGRKGSPATLLSETEFELNLSTPLSLLPALVQPSIVKALEDFQRQAKERLKLFWEYPYRTALRLKPPGSSGTLWLSVD